MLSPLPSPYVPVHFSYEMWRMGRGKQGEVYKQEKTKDKNVSKSRCTHD